MLRQVVSQKHLEKVIRDIFPIEDIVINARKPLDIKSTDTDHYLEVDVLLPHRQLGFEFQDFYHYATTWYYQNPVHKVQHRDSNKSSEVSKRGITLVRVPCWWDATHKSLIATILFHRPDIPHSHSKTELISLNPSEHFFDAWDVPEVGELMLASFAESPASVFVNKKNWWLGEKYDGIRCLWNQCELYSRKGTVLNLPYNHEELFIDTHTNIDGEIWSGRGLYHESIGVLHDNPDWHHLRIISFDNPSPLLNNQPFEHRYECLMAAITREHQFLIIAARLACTSPYVMVKMLQKILDDGGEGIIMRERRSRYTHGRSPSLVKFKAAREDMEALVVSANADSVKLQLPSGINFEVAPKDFNLHTSLTKGDVVTFEHEGRSRSEIPIRPQFSRIRTDVSWEHVCAEYGKQGIVRDSAKYVEKPPRYWTAKEGRKLRAFFESYARKRMLDPLVPETWYSISGRFFTKKFAKRGYKLKKGGYKQALLTLFPDIGLDASKFATVPAGYWEDVDNRKKYFDKLAVKLEFDPLVAKNWYSVSAAKLESAKGVLAYYGGSFVKALLHLYPNIGLDAKQFYVLPAHYWKQPGNLISFFYEFAKENGFDPTKAKKWYCVSVSQILETHKGASMLKFWSKILEKSKEEREKRGYWRWVLGTALTNVFPDIPLDIREFTDPNRFSRRKKFFESYAAHHSFDALVPTNWYSIPKDYFTAEKGGLQVLSHYNGSVMNALLDVFPDIGLERNAFPIPPGHWADAKNQKEFFDTFARENAFDPLIPANWYSVSLDKFRPIRGYNSLLNHIGGSIINGIINAYPNIGLNKINFQSTPSGFWSERSNRREFFDSFAKENGFDALEANNWYSVTSRQIQSAKGGTGMLKHYPGQSSISALTDVYPELHFDRHKFSSLPNGYWANTDNRKEFFDAFARDNKFDPLVASNWHSKSAQLRETKSYNTVLHHYKGGLQTALRTIYGFSGETT